MWSSDDAAQHGVEADEAWPGWSFAADMERPVSSPRDQFVDVVSPWGSETTVKAGRFDDESL
jgi:hypothetical protein